MEENGIKNTQTVNKTYGAFSQIPIALVRKYVTTRIVERIITFFSPMKRQSSITSLYKSVVNTTVNVTKL